MITAEKLQHANNKIFELIKEQCLYGKQSAFDGDNLIACGQFIGKDAQNLTQRGIYGTANALKILNKRNFDNKNELIIKMINYLQYRFNEDIRDAEHKIHSKIIQQNDNDEINVIKISEVLTAVSNVSPDVVKTEEFRLNLSSLLLQNIVQKRGWDHFINNAEKTQLLPTFYALQALKNNQSLELFNIRKEVIKSIIDLKMEDLQNKANDLSVYIFALYVLITNNLIMEDKTLKDIKKNILLPLWRVLEPLMQFDIEQNIEYWYEQETYYVRVPWQLYLIAITSKLSPYRLFVSSAVQDRLENIINNVLNNGFKYPHSGKMISTRTNAILYEVIEILQENIKTKSLLKKALYVFDRFRIFFSKKSLKIFFALVAFFFVSISIYNWHLKNGELSDIAPDLISAAIIWLLSLSKGNKN